MPGQQISGYASFHIARNAPSPVQIMELKEEKEPETEYAPVAVTNPTLSPRPFQGVRWGYELRGWLGLVPFLLFCLLFEILPVVIILEGSFTDSTTGAL